MNIAICIIAYNRVVSLERVLASVANAYYDEEVTLIISIDKSDIKEVAEYAECFKWEHGQKRVIKHAQNLGLRAHVLKCGDLLAEFDALIVLEDDISVVPSFYYYARQCVEKYYNNESVAGISLYSFPYSYHSNQPFYPMPSDSDVYWMQCAQSWGQVWMRKAWLSFKNWYDKHNEEFGDSPYLPHSICSWPKSSWLKYHTRYCIECDKYFVYPYVSLSTNNSDPGTHNKKNYTLSQAVMLYGEKTIFKLNPKIRYDAFFENELLYEQLCCKKEDLCIDYFGDKGNREKKRYWLTLSRQPYKVIRSFALVQKPYEWNIINDIKGDDLRLYDTSVHAAKPQRKLSAVFRIIKYQYKIQGIRMLISEIKSLLF